MGSICPKNTFFQLKHYVQRIYLTLLSTTFHCSSYNSPNFSCHFSNKNEFFFQVRITLPYFSSQTLYAFDKRNPSKCKFSDFQLLAWKLTKFLMLFFKPQVSFPLNFASPFSFTTPLKFCNWNITLWTKRAHQSRNLGFNESSPNSSWCQFWNHKV